MHIPKTAGSSLALFLSQQFQLDEICPCYYAYQPPPWGTKNLVLVNYSDKEITKYNLFLYHLGWIPRLYFSHEEIDTITFLRDPIDRMLSEFDHICRDAYSFPGLSQRWKSLDDFLWDPIYDDFYKANIQTRFFCSDLYFKLSSSHEATNNLLGEFVHLPFGYKTEPQPQKMLDVAIERLHSCAFVGIAEKFDDCLANLYCQYSWYPHKKTPKLNAAPYRAGRINLSAKTLDRAYELNQLDIALYAEAIKIVEDRHRICVAYDGKTWEKKALQLSSPHTEIYFTFKDKIIGENWHSREYSAQGVFCWSSDMISTLVFFINTQDKLYLSIRVLNFLVPDSHKKLTLTVNAYLVPLSYYIHPESGWVFEGIIPSQALGRENNLLELLFTLAELKRPIEVNPGSTDTRTLGFACQSITITSKPLTLATKRRFLRKNT